MMVKKPKDPVNPNRKSPPQLGQLVNKPNNVLIPPKILLWEEISWNLYEEYISVKYIEDNIENITNIITLKGDREIIR